MRRNNFFDSNADDSEDQESMSTANDSILPLPQQLPEFSDSGFRDEDDSFENGQSEAPPVTEADIDVEVEYIPPSDRDGMTYLLLIIILGSFGVHRLYSGHLKAIAVMFFVFFGLPQILLIGFGLGISNTILPPIITHTAPATSGAYSWLTMYWDYAKFVALAVIVFEGYLMLRGRAIDELGEPIRIKPSQEIFGYITVAVVVVLAILGGIGTQVAKQNEDPVLKKINDSTRYSN